MARAILLPLVLLVVIEILLTLSSSPEIQSGDGHCTVGKDDHCGWQSQNTENPTVMNGDLGE